MAMHPARLARTVSLSLILAPGLVGCGWINKAAAEDTKIVVFSDGSEVTVSIDAGEAQTISPGAFQSIAVGPGEHSVMINDREVSVSLEAFDRWVVPAVDNQCFFGIDVAASHYSANGQDRLGAPKIAQRRQESEPFKFPANHYLTESELPDNVSSGTLVYILRSLPCEEIDALATP